MSLLAITEGLFVVKPTSGVFDFVGYKTELARF
jgi:hypothetical protein